jgi:hypothetical protein
MLLIDTIFLAAAGGVEDTARISGLRVGGSARRNSTDGARLGSSASVAMGKARPTCWQPSSRRRACAVRRSQRVGAGRADSVQNVRRGDGRRGVARRRLRRGPFQRSRGCSGPMRTQRYCSNARSGSRCAQRRPNSPALGVSLLLKKSVRSDVRRLLQHHRHKQTFIGQSAHPYPVVSAANGVCFSPRSLRLRSTHTTR